MEIQSTRKKSVVLRTRSLILFLLEVGALAFYLWNCCVHDPIADKGHAPLPSFIIYLGIALFVGSILCFVIFLYTQLLALYTHLKKKDLIRHQLVTLSPLLLLYLSLLEHFVYLRAIRGVVLLCSVLGFAYLHYSFLKTLIEESSRNPLPAQKWGSIKQRISDPRRISRFVLILSILLYMLYASGSIVPAHPMTGDEPHYLLITKSLLSDGDINLFNNYRDQDYLQFYPGELESHALQGKKGLGYEYSKHAPGLPVLLVPSYFIGEKLGGIVSHSARRSSHQRQILVLVLHGSMGLIAALLCWIFFLFVRDFTENQSVALLSWFIFALTSPLVFYSHLIYPEIPASLLLILLLYRISMPETLSSSTFFWVGVGIALFPWLGIKYIVLCTGLFGIVLFKLWKSDRMQAKNYLLFIAPLLLSAGSYLFYLWSLYGNIWPSSIYKGYLPSGPSLSLEIFHFKFDEFFRCGLSYLFDQSVGIFAYAPIYLIFFPGMILSFVRKKRHSLPLLGMLLLYWGFCSSAYYWGGYCPPGRALLPVVFIMALFMGGALAWGKNKYSISIHRVLLFLSLGITFLCAREPAILYHEFLSPFVVQGETYSNLMNSLSNSVVDLRILVPSLINIDFLQWKPLIFWLLASVLSCLIFLKKEKRNISVSEESRKPVTAVFMIALSMIAYAFFDIHIDRAHLFKNKPYRLYFQDTNNFGQELSGFWTKGQKATEVLIKTDAAVANIKVRLSSPAAGNATIRVGRSKRSASRSVRRGLEKTLDFPCPVGFPSRNGYLYAIRIREDGGFYPYRLDPTVEDNRFLGVFVEIDVAFDE